MCTKSRFSLSRHHTYYLWRHTPAWSLKVQRYYWPSRVVWRASPFTNKGLARQTSALFTSIHRERVAKMAFCPNRREGCIWNGPETELENHLNTNNLTTDNWLEGCEHAIVKCIFCHDEEKKRHEYTSGLNLRLPSVISMMPLALLGLQVTSGTILA